MQFHEYINLRNQLAKFGHNDEAKRIAKSMSSEEFRAFFLEQAMRDLERSRPGCSSNQAFDRCTSLLAEQTWVESERPFYNVWPIAISLARDIKLDLPFAALKIPVASMLLRFALGNEPNGVTTSMLFWPGATPGSRSHICVICYFPGTSDRLTFRYDYESSDTVETWLQRIDVDTQTSDWRATTRHHQNADPSGAALLIRIVVFIALLSNETDVITPIVLAKDRPQYDAATDAETKRWLEERAVRKLGRGFDVGKGFQDQHDRSPHWRNPHLCLFWTGPGRTVPVIKLRSGAVVQKVSMAEVPTGFLGLETPSEDAVGGTFIYFIEAVGQDRIKIGKADNPESRLRQLQTGSAVELRLLGAVADNASREAETHAVFSSERIQGEWFHATPRLREYIARVLETSAPNG
jgi:hypothetical protein